jgi:uncharacterized repeat protein (TIGR02543 family)
MSSPLFKKVDSSDYISYKKRAVIAEEYRNVTQTNLNPIKKNGKKYNDNFIFVPTLNTPTTDISNCLLQAKSYELKQNYTYGSKNYTYLSSRYCPIIQEAPSTTYTVTYDGNGNTSGNPPVDGLSPYNSGSTVTVLGILGTILPLVNSGFDFDGWNTQADGSGTASVPGFTFVINGNTILYAMWSPQEDFR